MEVDFVSLLLVVFLANTTLACMLSNNYGPRD
jgi:hypothetical protein